MATDKGKGDKKITRIGRMLWRVSEGRAANAADQFFPFTMDDDQRLRTTTTLSVGSISVDLTYSDHVTILPGNPTDVAAESASNPSFTVARNADGTIASIEVLEYGPATRTVTRNASGLITAVSAWT